MREEMDKEVCDRRQRKGESSLVIGPPSLSCMEVREGTRKPDEEEGFRDRGMIHGLSAQL